MAGTNFGELISGLHGSIHKDVYDTINNKNLLIVNNKRQFSTTEDFDTVIAYEGDINSQIITIQCPKTYDSHNLSSCTYKELRWKNLGSGVEGVSNLLVDNTTYTEDYLYLSWEVPSDACTQAGILEISLTFYDKSGEHVAFAWNTAKYTGLSIGKTIESVNFAFPPKDEILIIDKDTKNIVAPVGYNNTICTYGDIDMTEIYFLVNRYLGKKNELDVFSTDSKIIIYVIMNESRGMDNDSNRITKQLYTEEISNRNKEGMVLISWKVPAGITAGTAGAKPLSIMIGIEQDTKKWFSNIYSNLKVGENLFGMNTGEPEKWGLLDEQVTTIINEYFEKNNFIIGEE